MCDNDLDGDGIINGQDNCPFVYNYGQRDTDSVGVGNACIQDCDGDGVKNSEDVCLCNSHISKTDFRWYP